MAGADFGPVARTQGLHRHGGRGEQLGGCLWRRMAVAAADGAQGGRAVVRGAQLLHHSWPRGIAGGVLRRPGGGMLRCIRPCRRGFTRFQQRKTLAGICLWSPAAPLPVAEHSARPTLVPTLIPPRSSAWILDTATAPGGGRAAATGSRCSAVAAVWETRQGEPAQAGKRRPGNRGNGAEERDKAQAAQAEYGTRLCVMELAAPSRGRSHPEAPAQQVRAGGARLARGSVGQQPHPALPRSAAQAERQAAAGGGRRPIAPALVLRYESWKTRHLREQHVARPHSGFLSD